MDHIVWKNAVYKKIVNREFQSSVNSHTECRLGQWYFNGLGKERYQHLRSFKSLNAPHQRVHDSGRQALEAGLKKDEPLMLQYLQAMEDASEEVVAIIDELIDEIHT
ncbi:CZB domain-containing protein [Vibrio nigripulchritudo]